MTPIQKVSILLLLGIAVYLIVAKIKGLPPFKKKDDGPVIPAALKGLTNAAGKPIMSNGSYIWSSGGNLVDGDLQMRMGNTGNLCIKNVPQNVNKWCSNYVPPDKTHTDFALIFKDGMLYTMDLKTSQNVFTVMSDPKATQVKIMEKGPVLM